MGLIRYPIPPIPAGAPARGALGIPPPDVEVDGGLVHVTLRTPEGVSWYGMGECSGPLLRNDASAVLWNTDVPRYGRNDASLYQSIPWVLGVLADGRAFGVYADTTWRIRIACKDEGGPRLELDAEGGAFDLWLVEGGSVDEVLRGLAGLIGTLPLPPLWALGYHQCRWSYAPAERVREIARGFRARGIPCDAVWLDIDHMDGFRSFTWDAAGFADPRGLTAELAGDGFRVVAILDPGIKAEPGYRVFDEGVAGGHFVRDAGGGIYRGRVWPGLCAFPDFVRAETRAWWSGLCAEHVRRAGLAGLWIDMNEPSVFRSPTRTVPRDALHAGGTHAEFHNVYGMRMAEATFRGLLEADPDARPFVLTRANFAGGQRFAAAWTGDNQSTWQDLRDSIPMVLNLGISGQPFAGPDIGGYEGDPDGELYARWMECASLMPFARGHSRKGNVAKEPWAFGAEVEEACRRALLRRYRLLPYLYTLFHEAERTGMPVVRPVFMADPRDARLRAVDDAFLLGEALLVAPVVERGAVARTVVLPGGRWLDFETGEVLEGGGTVEVPAPLGTLPLFARAGSLIPLARARQHTGEPQGPLELRVFPDADGRAGGAVYEDAGEGYGYRAGDYRRTVFAATVEGGVARAQVVAVEGNRGAGLDAEVRVVGGRVRGSPGSP